MLEVDMIEDIRKYETKVFMGQTKRQLICWIISIILAVPVAILFPVSISNKILLAAGIIVPFFFLGKADASKGTKPEIMLIRYVYMKYLTPKKRKCVQKNPYRFELEKLRDRELKKKVQKLNGKEKRTFLMNESKNTVIYSDKPENKIYR